MMAGLSEEEVKKACSEPDPFTSEFFLQHTMIRIKDPKVSLDFYTRMLGMRLLHSVDLPFNCTLYFLGYEKAEDIPKDVNERTLWNFNRSAIIELTHNWGTENDPDFKYHNGNDKPQGFGHIAVHVPDTQVASDRLEKLGVSFVKKPNEGKMKGVVFLRDPDGYWIELLDDKCIPKP